MARLRSSSEVVSYAIGARTEGMGARATGRTWGKSHTTILRWEARLVHQAEQWSPPAPAGADVTVEGDEVYTRIRENLPPSESESWTIHFVGRDSRYWVTAPFGLKDVSLFQAGVQAVPSL